ncbi:MAG: ATP-binding protein [Vicinamibacterales bacterium]
MRTTFFDTAERSGPEAIEASRELVAASPLASRLLESFPGACVLLDRNRQIVAVNRAAATLFAPAHKDGGYGLRLGEALGCIHAADSHGGCGTGPACAFCGAARAMRAVREGAPSSTGECRVTVLRPGGETSFDLRVHASPFSLGGEAFLLVAVEDISDQKRCRALERVFFHDVLNIANAVEGMAEMLRTERDSATVQHLAEVLARSARQLTEEVRAQRDLMQAERGELIVRPEFVAANSMLSDVASIYNATPLGAARSLISQPLERDVWIRTDRTLAMRCLGNLVKNALEAVDAGETVTLRARVEGTNVLFEVRNPGVIPEPIQLQIFQRSFSSKAAHGRGLGTYSVKLIAEKHLGGRVWFVSNPEESTVFTLQLPIQG